MRTYTLDTVLALSAPFAEGNAMRLHRGLSTAQHTRNTSESLPEITRVRIRLPKVLARRKLLRAYRQKRRGLQWNELVLKLVLGRQRVVKDALEAEQL